MNFVEILGYRIFSDDLSKITFDGKPLIINTINPHSYIVSKSDSIFQEALIDNDILLPDGIGIVWAVKLLTGKRINRITGYDIHKHLLNELNKSKGKVFYLGSSQATLNKIEERIKKEFPNIIVCSYSPPFKNEFATPENKSMIDAINDFNPDVLFVGMTAPKQEKWVYKNKEKLNVQIIASIGAVFDFYAGTVKRSSPFWIKIGLEWVPRFFQQPRKLWKRVLISNPLFVLEVLKNKLKNGK